MDPVLFWNTAVLTFTQTVTIVFLFWTDNL